MMRICEQSCRLIRGALFVCLIVVGALAADMVGAQAVYRSSVPANGATVPVAPARVVITFSQPTSATGSDGKVTNVAGAVVSTGWSVDPNPRTMLTIALMPNLPSGVYTVQYTSRADDGQTMDGSFIFTVRAGATGVTSGTAHGTSWGLWLAIIAAIAGFAVGGFFVVQRARQDYLAAERRKAAAPPDEPPS